MTSSTKIGAAVVAIALALSSCGGSDSDGSAAPTTAAPGGFPAPANGSPPVSMPPAAAEPVGPVEGAPAELPTDFPEGLRPGPDATILTGVANDAGWFVRAAIPGSVDEVADLLRAQLAAKGYNITSDSPDAIIGATSSIKLVAENDTLIVGISVHDAKVADSVDGAANVVYGVSRK